MRPAFRPTLSPSASCCRMPCRSAICAPSFFALWQTPIIQSRRIRQMALGKAEHKLLTRIEGD